MIDEKVIYINYLRDNNVKFSKQRETILDAFLAIEKHITVQELFDVLKRETKTIGIATVYRAMKIFCAAGLAQEVDVGDGNKRYEHKFNHARHDHLICSICGKIIEFNDPNLEGIQNKVCKELGFEPTERKLQIYGICKSCKSV